MYRFSLRCTCQALKKFVCYSSSLSCMIIKKGGKNCFREDLLNKISVKWYESIWSSIAFDYLIFSWEFLLLAQSNYHFFDQSSEKMQSLYYKLCLWYVTIKSSPCKLNRIWIICSEIYRNKTKKTTKVHI